MLARLFLLLVVAVIPGAAIAAEPAPAIGKPGARNPITPPTFRLPDLATPERYDLHLAIDPRADEFDGIVTIDARVKRATDVIWLNATALAIGVASVEQGDRAVDVIVVPGGEDFVGLQGGFQSGPARIRIAYRGKVDSVAVEGIFRQSEGGEWYALSQFQAIGARRALPCFDEPAWKTPWRITIDAPGSEVVVSNAPQTSATRLAGRPGWWRHEFAETRPLPTYLVALAVGPFDVVAGGVAGRKRTPLRFLAPRGRGGEARYAASVTPRLLESLEEYFGTPYPFEKLDSITIPQLVTFGAMENVGLITYGAELMLARSHEETPKFREIYAGLASHEIAHMWFGNLVTLAWWDDTWLNESFASWISSKVTYALQPAWDNGVYRGQSRYAALHADRLASARSIASPVETKNAIDDAFDDITYNKGEEVLAMFEAYLGPERFQAGVRAFLGRHAWGTATSKDFFNAMGGASGSPEAAVAALAAFVNQPGAPLLDVALDCSPSPPGPLWGKDRTEEDRSPALLVHQQRFRPRGSRAPDLRWTTPACFRYGAGGKDGTFCTAIEASTRRVELAGVAPCPAWIVGNAGGVGHYLVRYEDGLLKRIAERAGSLPEHEAQAWVKDSLLLAESGLIPVDAALAVADAALAHASVNVQLAGIKLLEGLRDDGLGPGELRAKEGTVAGRVMPIARSLGWTPRRDDSDDVRELRAAVMKFAADRETGTALRAEARGLALRWLGDRQAVDATIAGSALAVAGRFADSATFTRLETAAIEAENARERSLLLGALARVRDPRLRERALALVLASPGSKERLDGRSAFALLNKMLRDDENRAAAFDFVRIHLAAVEAKVPRDTPASLLEPMARLCTREQRTALADTFRESSARWMTGPLRYTQALESIDLCIATR